MWHERTAPFATGANYTLDRNLSFAGDFFLVGRKPAMRHGSDRKRAKPAVHRAPKDRLFQSMSEVISLREQVAQAELAAQALGTESDLIGPSEERSTT
jgi:hypothetical protein